MTDLEDRLTDALRRGADDAPYAAGLADGARRRARARRRHRAAAVGVAAALVVAVPTGVVLARGPGDAGPAATAPAPSPLPPADRGYRWESWRGVSVQVPQGWGTGSLSSWCGGGAGPTPRVERPGAAGDVGCTPAESYGLRFSLAPRPGIDWPVAAQDGDTYPRGAYVGAREVAGVVVTVATRSARLSQRVLDSVDGRSEFLVGGCPSISSAAGAAEEVGFVAVCGYGADGHLVDDRALDLVDSTAVRSDVQGAAVGTRPGCPARPSGALVRLLADDLDATVDLARGCLYVGTDDEQRVLPDSVRGLSGLSSPAAG